MSVYQTKTTVAQLLQSAWTQIQSLGFSDDKADSIQDHLDAVMDIINDKTKSEKPKDIASVDPDRKKRRKDKKDQSAPSPAAPVSDVPPVSE